MTRLRFLSALSLLFFCALTGARAQRVSVLAPPPDWSQLEAFQETMSRAEFARLLDRVYAPGGAWKETITLEPARAVIRQTLNPPANFILRFSADEPSAKPTPRFWRPAAALGAAPAGKPLSGMKIAIDPGHLGGAWARMEERFFQIGESRPVAEGEMTLKVAQLLVPKLEALGAEVVLVRAALDPVTADRPESLRGAARAELSRQGAASPRESYAGLDDPGRGGTVQFQSELLFYRMSEIRKRAEIVNKEIRPDLTVCLHFNAEAWGDPRRPEFVPRNHLHVLLNGCYAAGELRYDDIRLEMLLNLLSRVHDEERRAAEPMTAALARATNLPPYTYTTPNAVLVGGGGYIWARNLLANRLYRTPTLFLEPYVMNSEEVWARVQAGDYEGEIFIAGQSRRSIYREYADAVAEGLRDYAAAARSPLP